MEMSYKLNYTDYSLSKHAELQAQKRGIKSEIIAFIICRSGVGLYAGNDKLSMRISQSERKRLQMQGVSSALLEKSKNVVLIVSAIEAVVVTVMHDNGSKKGRCYRKQMPTKSRKCCWSRLAGMRPVTASLSNFAL